MAGAGAGWEGAAARLALGDAAHAHVGPVGELEVQVLVPHVRVPLKHLVELPTPPRRASPSR